MEQTVEVARNVAAALTSINNAPRVRVVDYTDSDGLVVGKVQVVQPDDNLVCGVETPTGTHIAMRICRFAAESAFLQQRTQDMLHNSYNYQRGPDERGEGTYSSP